MKKIISIIVILFSLITFTSCKKKTPIEYNFDKNAVINQLTNYRFEFTLNSKKYIIAKDDKALYYQLDGSTVMYQYDNKLWYDIDDTTKIKNIINLTLNNVTIEELVPNLVTSYISGVNNSFILTSNLTLNGYDAEKYQYNNITYYVDTKTKVCLKAETDSTTFEVKNYSLDYNLNNYIDYDETNENNYINWPKHHPLLENVKQIEYGMFYTAYSSDNSITIVLKNISKSVYERIIDELTTDLFFDIIEDKSGDVLSTFKASDGKNFFVELEHYSTEKELTLVFTKEA